MRLPIKKMFYDRSTNSAAFCAIQKSLFQNSLPFYANQIINPFLNSRI